MAYDLSINATILEAAEQHLGIEEWPGAKHNPAVLAYFENSGNGWVKDDETPWCAAFVNSVLASLGMPGTGKLNARSFEKYGEPVQLQEVRPGDIVVFWRGDPHGWQGHVGFVASIKDGKVNCLGGNQSNKVSIAPYPMSRVVAFRRATGVPTKDIKTGRPTLKQGDRGAFVTDLQDQLAELKYGVGKVDGIFGDNTRRAVVQFQSDNGLKADGIVGPQTWEALELAPQKDGRNISTEELRETGSRTIKTADKAETEIKMAAGGLTGIAVVDVITSTAGKITAAQSNIETLQMILANNWPVLLVIAVAGGMYFRGGDIMSRIRRIRTQDAQSGANMQR